MLLLITAGILTAMMVSALVPTPAAYGGDASVRQGKYIMTTGSYDVNLDLIYVVNIETQKLAVYAPNVSKRTLDKMGVTVSLNLATTTRK